MIWNHVDTASQRSARSATRTSSHRNSSANAWMMLISVSRTCGSRSFARLRTVLKSDDFAHGRQVTRGGLQMRVYADEARVL